MAFHKTFSYAVPDKKKDENEKKKKDKLTVLKENDSDTIFNLLFTEPSPKRKEE